MKLLYSWLSIGLMMLLTLTITEHTFAQEKDKDGKREARRPKSWPRQVITEKTIVLSSPHVINFQQLADSQAAHYVPYHTGFIEQEEDKDAEFKFMPHNIPGGTPTFDPNQLLDHHHQANQPQHQPESPAPTGYFLGTSSNGSEIPPDVDGAAGPTYVLETNNQQYDIYNKTGVLQSTLNIGNFFSATAGSSSSYFDPHVLYDPNYQRYILVSDGNIASNNDGGLFIGISETSDPTGNWYTYAIDNGDASASDLLDYPEVGYNNNWVTITTNDFVGNNVTGDVYVFNRDSLYNGLYGNHNTLKVKLFTDNNAFSWAPAQTYGTTEDTLWMVQDGNGGNGAMQVGCITGPVGAPVYNAGGNIAVTQTWNENSIDVGQLGGGTTELINDDDTRVGNGSFYLNGTLWFTHTIYLPATGTATYSGVDWWEVVPSSLTLKQFGRIDDPNKNTNYYYPSINVNANGDALLGYCMSGTDSFYPSAAYSFHAAADPVNYMESRYIYKPGAYTYYETLGGGRNRYGDFTGTSVDPNDQSFWNYSEYPVSKTLWGIVIAHVGASTPPTNPPVASFMANDTVFTCSGIVQFTDLSTNLPTSWLWNFGDGTTDTLENPTHQYTTNGTFSVTLKATNPHGSGTQTYTSYITISLPPAPAASNVTHCGASTFSLSASTTDNVGWFDSTGTLVASTNPFVTPLLSTTTTYWVQDTIPGSFDSVGPATYTTLGTGSIFANTNSHYLSFDALGDFTLISVLVDASTAGSRTIQLINAAGTVIATTTPNIGVGVSTVTLNFSVPTGVGYELALAAGTSDANLYRNNGGATNGNTNYYPITLAGVVSITGSDAGAGYYYYFYDWKVKGPSCVSAQTPVTATIGAGSLSITPHIAEVSCYGLSTGSVSLTVGGGTPNYTYQWNNGQTTDTAINLVAGAYLVTVTDAGGCTTTASETVTGPAAALSAATTVTNATCYGSSTGVIDLTANGGTTNYTYNWGGGITTSNRSGVAAGTYTVTVTDAHGCTTTASATVGQNAAIVPVTSSTASGCGTSATGSATVTATGGTSVYTYHWSNGQTDSTATSLTSGSYLVTVTDGAGCTATASATVNQASSTLVTNTSVTNANCYGLSTGDVNLTVTGGASGYTYNWGGGITSQNLSGVRAGTYTVTVTDANLCTISASAVVGQPTAIVGVTSVVNAGCGVSSSGSASVAVTGGIPGYTYLWSNSQTTDTITNLGGGIYTVIITDSHTCSATASASITNSGALTLSASSINVSCYGGSNGSATVTETGGTGTITYTWSVPGSGATISNLPPATYTVTVSDVAGCTNTATQVITQPDSITIHLTTSPAACGASNGSVNAAVSGGTSGYNYKWNTSATTPSISGLGSGTYTVTVTDANTCTAVSSTTLSGSSSLVANLISSNATCNGLNNGGASATVTSGTSPFTYAWSNNGTGNAISNLYAGTYYVTITDSFGCHTVDSISVNQPTNITIIINASQPTCNGASTGSASLTVTGGTPNYTYLWSTGSTSNSVSGLAPGSYPVTVKDDNGCSATADLTINTVSNVSASIQLVVNDSCFGGQDGAAQVTATGGSNTYSYLWSNADTTAAISNLASGIYTVTVSNNNNCSTTASVTISQPGEIIISTSTTNATNGQSNGAAIVSITGGFGPYTVSWSNQQTGDTITNLAPGTYTVTVADKNGCQQATTITVNNITGIENVAGAVGFNIYPNPAKTQVVVAVDNVGSQTEVWLKDILGQTLYIRPISSAKTVIDLTPYANGLYLIEVTEGHDHSTQKLVIAK